MGWRSCGWGGHGDGVMGMGWLCGWGLTGGVGMGIEAGDGVETGDHISSSCSSLVPAHYQHTVHCDYKHFCLCILPCHRLATCTL